MAACSKCYAELAVYERICPLCGADVRRDVSSNAERWRARFCHLVSLPGMLIFVVLAPVSLWFALVPVNLIAPIMYRLVNSGSRTVRSHAVEVLNFQVLWTAVMFLLWSIFLLTEFPVELYTWLLMWAIWLSGVSLVAFRVYDLGNSGDGRYPIRIPLFRLANLPTAENGTTGEPKVQSASPQSDSIDRGRDESSVQDWQCSVCNALVAANQRSCPYCRLGVRPDRAVPRLTGNCLTRDGLTSSACPA